ncbi:hypothetical protein WMY93_021359 [Mugilogobius chulae]|uniref:Uncharacterized protein n=1 Tax=Mugilogobius chulae TaxID=88201 RepID=A0AAW0NLN8_9GOBI
MSISCGTTQARLVAPTASTHFIHSSSRWKIEEPGGTAQSEDTVRDQLILGLRPGPIQQELQRMNSGKLKWLTLKAANGLAIPYVGYVMLDFDVAGVTVPDKGAIIVKDSCLGADKAILGMNVIFSCWESLFKGNHPGITAFKVSVSAAAYNHWERAFAVCSRVAHHETTDGKIGEARLPKNITVEVPPESEMVVWTHVLGADRLPHGDVLVEATTEGSQWQVARTVCYYSGGKIPVRILNLNPYPITIPSRQTLASVFLLSAKQICNDQDVVLTATDKDTLEVDIRTTQTSLPSDDSFPTLRGENLTPEQQYRMDQLMHRWSSVFALNEEDFGRTSAVLHQIPTEPAPVQDQATAENEQLLEPLAPGPPHEHAPPRRSQRSNLGNPPPRTQNDHKMAEHDWKMFIWTWREHVVHQLRIRTISQTPHKPPSSGPGESTWSISSTSEPSPRLHINHLHLDLERARGPLAPHQNHLPDST